jgi:hypothetical protein
MLLLDYKNISENKEFGGLNNLIIEVGYCMHITNNRSLDSIERQLQKKLKDSVVVSEIDLSDKDFDRLLDLLKKHVTLDDQKERINYLWTVYPYTSLVITVFIAVYKYDGNLWGHFTEKTGIEETNIWSKEMMTFLKSNDIRVFHEKDRQKYFSTVLGHAGIPYYSVEKLLQNIIVPANQNGLNEIDIYENVKKLDNSLIHKGVKTFIGLGDKVSLSMIHRIQTVWRNNNKPFISHYRNYLPNHILQAMDEYKPQEEQSHFDYERPFVKYIVEEETIKLRIPSVRVKDTYVKRIYWLIREEQSNKSQEIELEYLEYEDRSFEEFSPGNEYIDLNPNHTYSIELYYEDEEFEYVHPIYQDYISIKPPFIQFNQVRKIVQIEDAYLEKEHHIVTLIVENNQVKPIRKNVEYANVYEKGLSGKWRNYSAVTLVATKKETVTVGKYIIYLNNILKDPYLGGDKQDNLVHTDYPVFKEIPYIVIPEKVLDEIKAKTITNIRLSNQKSKRIDTANIVIKDNEARLYVKDLFPDTDEKMTLYSITMYGKLGYDYHLTFLLIKDLCIKLNNYNNTLQLDIPNDYSINVQWPMNVDMRKKKNSYEIYPPDQQYKLKAILFNRKTQVRFDVILYTVLYQIQFISTDQTIYPLGSEISREVWRDSQLEMEIDTTNPTFEKIMGKQTEMKIVGDSKKISYHIFSNSIFNLPTDVMFEKNVKKDITYQYKFSGEVKLQPLLVVKNKWYFKHFEKNLDGMHLSLKWEQSNYINDKFIRIWKLHKPHEGHVDILLKKRTRTFYHQFDEAGIYMVEWKDANSGESTKPCFEKGKYEIFHINTDKSLAYFLLLLEDDSKNSIKKKVSTFEYEFSSIIDLLKRIYHFGKDYLSLIVKDYDTCCVFGVRASDVVMNIYKEKKIGKNLKNILTEITGVQELSDKPLFTINNELLNFNYRINFEKKLNQQYFSQERLLTEVSYYSSKQLNITMQEQKPFSPIIFNFNLRTVIVKYFYKMKNDDGYSTCVNDLLTTYGKQIENIYLKQKASRNKEEKYHVFQQIEARNFSSFLNNNSKNFRDYPYFIAQLALVNSSFVRFSEDNIDDKDRINIRKATQQILRIDKLWFLHDLFYLALSIEEMNRKAKKKIPAKKRNLNKMVWK